MLPKNLLIQVNTAKSWAIKRLPGFSEQAHRDLLARFGAGQDHSGRYTSKALSIRGALQLIEHYHNLGWPRRTRKPIKTAGQRLMSNWGGAARDGVIDNGGLAACWHWCSRQLGRKIGRLEDMSQAEHRQLEIRLRAMRNKARRDMEHAA